MGVMKPAQRLRRTAPGNDRRMQIEDAGPLARADTAGLARLHLQRCARSWVPPLGFVASWTWDADGRTPIAPRCPPDQPSSAPRGCFGTSPTRSGGRTSVPESNPATRPRSTWRSMLRTSIGNRVPPSGVPSAVGKRGRPNRVPVAALTTSRTRPLSSPGRLAGATGG